MKNKLMEFVKFSAAKNCLSLFIMLVPLICILRNFFYFHINAHQMHRPSRILPSSLLIQHFSKGPIMHFVNTAALCLVHALCKKYCFMLIQVFKIAFWSQIWVYPCSPLVLDAPLQLIFEEGDILKECQISVVLMHC